MLIHNILIKCSVNEEIIVGFRCVNAENLLLQDRGDEFTYTGSGGKNLAGNKRIGAPSADQTLTNMNRYSLLLEFVRTILNLGFVSQFGYGTVIGSLDYRGES